MVKHQINILSWADASTNILEVEARKLVVKEAIKRAVLFSKDPYTIEAALMYYLGWDNTRLTGAYSGS